jgi:hypothetical protein
MKMVKKPIDLNLHTDLNLLVLLNYDDAMCMMRIF